MERSSLHLLPAPSDSRALPTNTQPFGFAAKMPSGTAFERFLRLADLPPPPTYIPPSVVTAFHKTLARCCEKYLENRTVESYLDIIAIPKACIAPALRNGRANAAVKRLEAWPDLCEWPEPSFNQHLTTHSPADRAKRLVEYGRVGSACRALSDNNKVAKPTPDVVAKLKSKHPTGEASPYRTVYRHLAGCESNAVEQRLLADIIHRLPTDLGTGISGWPVPLLKLSAKSKPFLDFMEQLCGALQSGRAAGRELLCTSRLTALRKEGDDVRPIAAGEIIYRVCAMAILAANPATDALAPFQFGVGSKGGTEPVIRAVKMAVDGDLDEEYSHLTMLDLKNAFNMLCRLLIAKGIRKHCPSFIKFAKWSYNDPAALVIKDPEKPAEVIESSQGVRQGDPMGPLFFSVGIRDILCALQEHLGPDVKVMAYLDDIYILSKSHNTLTVAADFLRPYESSGIQLNRDKSKTIPLDHIRHHGIEILGSFIGPRLSRLNFLRNKIQLEVNAIPRLATLPHQHALLCLRLSIQQKLKHLLRTLQSHDILEEWRKWDQALRNEFRRIAGLTAPHRLGAEAETALISLPARFGGCGITSHTIISKAAFTAAQAAAQDALEPLFPTVPVSISPKSQRELCDEVHTSIQNLLLSKLTPLERGFVVENGSALGRRWMGVLPTHALFTVPSFHIAAGLRYRTLASARTPYCPRCHVANTNGHSEACLKISRRRHTQRHDDVKNALGAALRTVSSLTIQVEPEVPFDDLVDPSAPRHTDLRVTGSAATGVASDDFDVKVTALAAAYNAQHFSDLPIALNPPSYLSHTNTCVNKILTTHKGLKHRLLPLVDDASIHLTPLIFTAGGLVEMDTLEVLKSWKKIVAPGIYGFMLNRISVSLLMARGYTASA